MPDTAFTIAFVGGGNMAAALIAGLRRAGHSGDRIAVVEPVEVRRDHLIAQYGVRAQADAEGLQADLIVLAVKPQQMQAALTTLRPAPGTTVLSIAAGVPVAAMAAALPDCEVIRSMPNTPALVGAGISALYATPDTGAAARTRAATVLAAAGTCVWVDDETLLDAVTALSGSGPAYYFRMTEALADAGIALGLPADTAHRLARQTLIGAAALAAADDTPMAQLRAQVTSKGGTTEAALQSADAQGLQALWSTALTAARDRGAALGADIRQSLGVA